MTYFTDGPIVRRQRDASEFGSSLGEVFSAAFQQGIAEDPILGASSELENAQLGQPIIGERLPEGVNVPRRAPDTPLLTADEAKARVKDSGLPITIDGDIREGALNILLRRKQEEMQRQFILSSGPRGSAPVAILAGFAASAIDPLNIASAFIPVVGEARYARMLAAASGASERAGVRAGVGALEGAVGAAAVEPLVLQNAREYQADYDMSDSLTNIAFGSILGGGLHSLGGAYTDWRRSRLLESAQESQVKSADTQPDIVSGLGDTMAPRGTSPAEQTAPKELFNEDIRPLVKQQIQETAAISPFRPHPDDENIVLVDPKALVFREEEQHRTEQVKDIFSEGDYSPITIIQEGKKYSILDGHNRAVVAGERGDLLPAAIITKAEYEDLQSKGFDDLEISYATLTRAGQDEAASELNRQFPGTNIADRGTEAWQELPDTIPFVDFQGETAREIAESAPHLVRQSALKAAVAQAMTGREADVENIFRMASEPDNALQRVAEPPSIAIDKEAEAASLRADEITKTAKDDQAELEQSASFDEEMAQAVADQLGLDLKAELKDVDTLAKNADIYTKAWRAAAICSMRQ